MKSSHILQIPNFSPSAKELRAQFDTRFADPKAAHADRFVWDYWHLPGLYTHLRTPAYQYFSEKLYLRWHKEIVLWGRRTLGCWDISPPWLSLYVNGMQQALHSDVPHGPWAFVFSLNPQKLMFTGGETLIIKPEVLNYWKSFTTPQSREIDGLVDRIYSKFNQLTVFDPRYPHSVTEVRGVEDPRQGRLVMHGWFTEPKTYIEGPLPAKSTEQILNAAFENTQELILAAPPTQGVLSLQLYVGTNGRVNTLRWGTQNLLDQQGQKPTSLLRKIQKNYVDIKFATAREGTLITVPLIVS